MQLTVKSYRTLALMLWGTVCGLAGWTVGQAMAWEGRKLFFAVLVTVGGYVLLLLERSSRDRAWGEVKKRRAPGSRWPQEVDNILAVKEDQVNGDVPDRQRVKDNEHVIRRRLDEFLLMQQDK